MKRLLLPSMLLALCAAAMGQPEINAAQLAAKMALAVEDGDASARVRMKTSDGKILQVQIKSRRTDGDARVVYEVLWPAERKGEKVALSQSKGGWPGGEAVDASGQRAKIDRTKLGGSIFGTDLAYADAIENFFLWPRQQFAEDDKIGGRIGNIECVILESRPAGSSPHGRVRSWIDPEKLVVHRVEKYDTSGRLQRTIITTRVAKDDAGRNIPANLTVQRPAGTTTEIEGSNIRHDIKMTDEDFALGADRFRR